MERIQEFIAQKKFKEFISEVETILNSSKFEDLNTDFVDHVIFLTSKYPERNWIDLFFSIIKFYQHNKKYDSISELLKKIENIIPRVDFYKLLIENLEVRGLVLETKVQISNFFEYLIKRKLFNHALELSKNVEKKYPEEITYILYQTIIHTYLNNINELGTVYEKYRGYLIKKNLRKYKKINRLEIVTNLISFFESVDVNSNEIEKIIIELKVLKIYHSKVDERKLGRDDTSVITRYLILNNNNIEGLILVLKIINNTQFHHMVKKVLSFIETKKEFSLIRSTLGDNDFKQILSNQREMERKVEKLNNTFHKLKFGNASELINIDEEVNQDIEIPSLHDFTERPEQTLNDVDAAMAISIEKGALDSIEDINSILIDFINIGLKKSLRKALDKSKEIDIFVKIKSLQTIGDHVSAISVIDDYIANGNMNSEQLANIYFERAVSLANFSNNKNVIDSLVNALKNYELPEAREMLIKYENTK